MNWFAIRRSQSSNLRHKARTLGRVTNGPPHPSKLVPKLIRPSKVLLRPSLLTLLHQLLSPLIPLSTLLRLGKGAETDELQHLRDPVSCRILRNVTPVRFSHKLKNLSKRLRRIEVISKRIAKRLLSGSGSVLGLRGRLAGPSPLFARRVSPGGPQRLVPKEIPQPLNPSHRFLHLLGPKGKRLPIVPRDQVSHDRLAPISIKRRGELKDIPLGFRHLRRIGLDHPVVHPDPGEGPPRPLGLGDLVLMVGEDEVGAAAVDREGGAELLLGHHRALDVPGGPSRPPWRVPARVLVGLVRLPEGEVEPVLLQRG